MLWWITPPPTFVTAVFLSWKVNYVLWDFEINQIQEEKLEWTIIVQDVSEDNTITVLGKKYRLTPIE